MFPVSKPPRASIAPFHDTNGVSLPFPSYQGVPFPVSQLPTPPTRNIVVSSSSTVVSPSPSSHEGERLFAVFMCAAVPVHRHDILSHSTSFSGPSVLNDTSSVAYFKWKTEIVYMIIKQRSLAQDKKTTYFSGYSFFKERIRRYVRHIVFGFKNGQKPCPGWFPQRPSRPPSLRRVSSYYIML